MALPDWLIKATGAMPFADPLKNGGAPTFGDAMQGVGHSMMENYRRGQVPSGTAGSATAMPQMSPLPAFMPQVPTPPPPVGALPPTMQPPPQSPAPPPGAMMAQGGAGGGLSLPMILAALGQGGGPR